MMAFKGKKCDPLTYRTEGEVVGMLSKGAACAEAGVGINIYVPHVAQVASC